jgi:5'-methylthioadenosine phosphorylase
MMCTMAINIGVIGGTGLYGLNALRREEIVQTPFGAVIASVGTIAGKEVAFLARHEKLHGIPPHAINYEANMTALVQLGVERVIGITAVGALNAALRVGDYVIPDQFIDFTKSRHTVFMDEVRHVDMRHPYCEVLRTILKAALKGRRFYEKGSYVCVEGPRFETEAEITMYRALGGDVIGMTNAHEATLARELSVCYATLSLVTNETSAAGTSHEDVVRFVASKKEEIEHILYTVIQRITPSLPCLCPKG